MTLRPIQPTLPDESLTSYIRRAAEFHAKMDVYTFLDMIGLSRAAVMDPTPEDLVRISSLTGQPLETLHAMVLRSAGPRMYRLGDEIFHSEFAKSNHTAFCPACLLEDGVHESPSAGLRVGRVSWRLEPVRTCRRHGIALVRRCNTSHGETFQHMDHVAPDDIELRRLVATAEQREPSALQDYVEGRLAGRSGPAWLDGQPVDLAARACEMLGLLLNHGASRQLPAVSTSELDAAGAVGYAHASNGEGGIRAALHVLLEASWQRSANGGPQQAFGFLYNWLQFKKNRKPCGPIREVMRDFVLEHFAVEPGTMLFGEELTQRRKHTVSSLARSMSEHPRTVRNAMKLAGFIGDDPNRPVRQSVFEAEPAEALIIRLRTAMTVRDLQGHLNCTRMQATGMVYAGILPRIVDVHGRAGGMMKLVAREDADAFLSRLLAASGAMDSDREAGPGMIDIAAAAEVSRWPVVDIVEGILAGRFKSVACPKPELRFKGVLVDPAEVRAVLSRQVCDDHITVDEAARLLDLLPVGVLSLARCRDAAGEPYLREEFVVNAKGVSNRVFLRADVQKFLKEHIALRDIASVGGIAPRWMKPQLDARGIAPIAPHRGIGRLYYRRSDLGDPAPG